MMNKKNWDDKMSIPEQIGLLHVILKNLTTSSIIFTDKNGIIRAWNEGAAIEFGYSATQIIGKKIFLLLNN